MRAKSDEFTGFVSKPVRTGRHKSKLPILAAAVGGVLLMGLAVAMLFTKTDVSKHKVVTQITLVVPPPPPPKPEEKPPEPPKPKEEVKLDEPKPQDEPKPAPADQPPPGPIGLDANGSGPGDGFGLAGRPGGRDITVGHVGGGGLGMTVFGASTARHIAQELARDPKLKNVNYQVEIRIWLSKDGRFEREEIVRGTGDRDLDALIRAGLGQVSSLQQAVPANLPQPLHIRVTSSDA
jgi:protein TonB